MNEKEEKIRSEKERARESERSGEQERARTVKETQRNDIEIGIDQYGRQTRIKTLNPHYSMAYRQGDIIKTHLSERNRHDLKAFQRANNAV